MLELDDFLSVPPGYTHIHARTRTHTHTQTHKHTHTCPAVSARQACIFHPLFPHLSYARLTPFPRRSEWVLHVPVLLLYYFTTVLLFRRAAHTIAHVRVQRLRSCLFFRGGGGTSWAARLHTRALTCPALFLSLIFFLFLFFFSFFSPLCADFGAHVQRARPCLHVRIRQCCDIL